MDLLIFESVGAAVVAATSAVGGRALVVRNQRNRQKEATDARLAAAAASEAFLMALQEARLLVPTLLDRLGPQDAAAPGGRADTVLSTAQGVHDAYTTLLAGADPTEKHPRRVYIRLARQYNQQETRFSQLRQDLVNLVAQFKQLTTEVDSVGDIRAAAATIIAAARMSLDALAKDGWSVTSFENRLDDLDTLLQQGNAAAAASELLTARREFEQARLRAATVANEVRELPRRQRSLVQKANMFVFQHTALTHDFERAEVGLATVRGVYAETVLAGIVAGLSVAKMRHTQMERLIQELNGLLSPALDAWDRADMIVAQLTEIVEEITAACAAAIVLRKTLDEKMAELRKKASDLRSEITELSLTTRNRDGHQKAIRKALKRLDAEVVTFNRQLDDPLQDPNRLSTRYDELANLLERVDTVSYEMDHDGYDDDDEDDEDSVLTISVTTAAAAVGVNLLDD